MKQNVRCYNQNMSNNIKFTNNLVKGRIAETIFAQMLRNEGQYTVLEFGYEKIIPQLVGLDTNRENAIIESLRVAPDFAVINQETKEVRLVEVKFQANLSDTYTLGAAKKMHASRNPSWLFIATLDGFYFDEISAIITNEGRIMPFDAINRDTQDEYLKILKDFESSRRYDG